MPAASTARGEEAPADGEAETAEANVGDSIVVVV